MIVKNGTIYNTAPVNKTSSNHGSFILKNGIVNSVLTYKPTLSIIAPPPASGYSNLILSIDSNSISNIIGVSLSSINSISGTE